jgi:SDR family mycofactocin-dependent oxidoreductase
MGALDGKVAFITGAARGQGRSHAVLLASAGADIIAVDICEQIPTVPYPLAGVDDLAETVSMVEQLGRRIVSHQADVRDLASLSEAFQDGVDKLGGVDIVLANAGIAPMGGSEPDRSQVWRDVLDVNLTGAWNTIEAAAPTLIQGGRGGAIVLTSSTAGLKGLSGGWAGGTAYAATKHALVGVMRSLARDLAPHSIRVNTVHPTGVRTPMIINEATQVFFAANEAAGLPLGNALPVAMVEPIDVSNAILWLVSDAARYVTGIALPVDAGATVL